MEDLVQKEETVLRPFFETLEHNFSKSSKEKEYHFFVEIGGKKLMMCFSSREQAGIVERCFVGRCIPEIPNPDARFCFWTDDCSRYIGTEASSDRWRYRREDGYVIFLPGRWLIGVDVFGHTFYYDQYDPLKQAQIPSEAVGYLVSLWAGMAGLIPVHGAAVGVGDRGVLLVAQGGGGKSTLAASCLLSGMDYVADDHLLVNAEGPLRAVPIFSTLKLNPDMKAKLGVNLPVIWEYASRGGKQLLDASSFPICRDMTVCAMVFLSRWDREQAEISMASRPNALRQYNAVRLAQSVLQYRVAYDPPRDKATVERFSKLPAYEMRLGSNLRQNADALRTWIERME